MAEEHFGLAPAVATYYAKRNPHLEMEDLIQEGRFGIVYALDRFNVDKGYRFSTYATYWIKHFIQRFVVANHSLGLSAKRKDTEAYIGSRMSHDEQSLYQQRCLDTLTTAWATDENAVFENVLPGDDDVEQEVFDLFDQHAALKIIASDHLTDRERRVVAMRYGVLGQRPQTVLQVARRLSLSVHVVNAIEGRTIALLQELMEIP